jgi:hypothetical protein
MSPGSEPKKITALFAFVCTEADGSEGVPAFTTTDGLVVPLLGADEARIYSLRPMAQVISDISRRPMRMVRFTGMEVIGEVKPCDDPGHTARPGNGHGSGS